MKKNVLIVISFVVMAGVMLSCNIAKEKGDTKEMVDSLKTVESESVLADGDGDADGKSLNDIRFADFSEKDWLDNDYVRALREYLNAFLDGKVEDEGLEPYRDDVRGKFVIANVEPFMLGGLFFQIIFIDKPEKVFSAWVYSDVDEEKEKVVGYDVRYITLDERNNEFSKEEIFQEMEEHPELKLW